MIFEITIVIIIVGGIAVAFADLPVDLYLLLVGVVLFAAWTGILK